MDGSVDEYEQEESQFYDPREGSMSAATEERKSGAGYGYNTVDSNQGDNEPASAGSFK